MESGEREGGGWGEGGVHGGWALVGGGVACCVVLHAGEKFLTTHQEKVLDQLWGGRTCAGRTVRVRPCCSLYNRLALVPFGVYFRTKTHEKVQVRQ